MAAASNKPGVIHYALFFFVFLSMLLGLMFYWSVRAFDDRKADIAKVEEDNQKNNKALQKAADNLQKLKTLIGSKFEEFDGGPGNQENPATVVGDLRSNLQTYGQDVAAPTVLETLKRLRDALNAAMADRDSKSATVAKLEKEVIALSGKYQAQVDNYDTERKAAETAKRDVIGDRDEKIGAKNQKIQELNGTVQTVRLQLSEEQEQRAKKERELNVKISQLEGRITFLREKIDNLEKLSFESAKGVITHVEHSNHTVLLNVGEDDHLKTRMTFSVYAKENLGVGRGAEDIKGKIEVIKIIGPHMSVAKVIDEDLTRPIVPQDLIYTPLWTPGLIEKISIIGFIDLDNDGRSDREQFRQMLAAAGCVIDNEVDDDGNRIPPDGKITVQTRFLVKGDMPDRAEAQTDKEKERADKFNSVYHTMEDEARTNGVRIIKMNDFLAYIGFQNKRRVYLPGKNTHFDLKSGNNGAGASTDRTSNGQVSGVFKKGKRGPQETSNGATSGSTQGYGQ